ncbi:MAG: hypothetical protein ACXWWD_00725 [Chitinophagaceae bacterium]
MILMFGNPDQDTYKMKLEISMHFELLERKVRMLVYEHERDDDEEGETVD